MEPDPGDRGASRISHRETAASPPYAMAASVAPILQSFSSNSPCRAVRRDAFSFLYSYPQARECLTERVSFFLTYLGLVLSQIF